MRGAGRLAQLLRRRAAEAQGGGPGGAWAQERAWITRQLHTTTVPDLKMAGTCAAASAAAAAARLAAPRWPL